MALDWTYAQATGLLRTTHGADAFGLPYTMPNAYGWTDLVRDAAEEGIGLVSAVPGGEFVAVPVRLNGRAATLVAISWTNGGFERAALVKSHPATLGEAAEMWLGDTDVSELEDGHVMLPLLEQDAG